MGAFASIHFNYIIELFRSCLFNISIRSDQPALLKANHIRTNIKKRKKMIDYIPPFFEVDIKSRPSVHEYVGLFFGGATKQTRFVIYRARHKKHTKIQYVLLPLIFHTHLLASYPIHKHTKKYTYTQNRYN